MMQLFHDKYVLPPCSSLFCCYQDIKHRLSVVIISLININSWPYLRINNFQLIDQTRSMLSGPTLRVHEENRNMYK